MYSGCLGPLVFLDLVVVLTCYVITSIAVMACPFRMANGCASEGPFYKLSACLGSMWLLI